MRILIAGAGTIGFHLTSALAREGLDIIIIDPNANRLSRLENNVDCQIITASATSPQVLEDAQIRQVDMVIAVTDSDAINITICQLAAFYGVKRKLARIRSPELSSNTCPVPSSHFGIDHIISPEGLTVDYLTKLVKCPGSREAVDFEDGLVSIRAYLVSEECELAGKNLINIRQHIHGDFLVAAIRRGGRTIIPDGQEVLRIGDTVYLVCAPDLIPQLGPIFDPTIRPAKKIIIFGAGIAGRQLALALNAEKMHVYIIEPDEQLALNAANMLDHHGIQVLHGTASDLDLLQRCHVETADFFIALTDNDESNLTASLLYRKYGSGRPIVQTNQVHYIDILDSIDFDIVINPRLLAVSSILRYVRSGHVVSGFKLIGEDTEILEFHAEPESKITRAAVKDLKLPKSMLIVAVIRNHELHIPNGLFRIMANDRVLIFSAARSTSNLESFFK